MTENTTALPLYGWVSCTRPHVGMMPRVHGYVRPCVGTSRVCDVGDAIAIQNITMQSACQVTQVVDIARDCAFGMDLACIPICAQKVTRMVHFFIPRPHDRSVPLCGSDRGVKGFTSTQSMSTRAGPHPPGARTPRPDHAM